METVLHKSHTRGQADHGWLQVNHTFSFANYFDPDRLHFGALRVLNDDIIAKGMGFGTHPHQNMEIITIPLKGVIKHKDSMGNTKAVKAGEVQVMSAGTGVEHSEFNGSEEEDLHSLQIWVMPLKLNIEPRYDQKTFSEEGRKDQWQTLVSPMGAKEDGGLKINQESFFSRATLTQDKKLDYKMQSLSHGLYVFVLSGSVSVNEVDLESRDGLGLSQLDQETVRFHAQSDADVLLMEVPMIRLRY